MRNLVVKNYAVILFSAALTCLLVVAVVIGATKFLYAEPQGGDNSAPTLEQQAKNAGGRFVTKTIPARSALYNDLSPLAERSTAVVVGTVIKNVCRLTPDGRGITTDYVVRVDDSLKGHLRQGARFNLSLPGGRVMFKDGSFAEVAPASRPLANNKSYVLFLTGSQNKDGFFELASTPQGSFELSQDGSAISETGGMRLQDPLVKQYEGRGAATFIEDVRTSAKGRK